MVSAVVVQEGVAGGATNTSTSMHAHDPAALAPHGVATESIGQNTTIGWNAGQVVVSNGASKLRALQHRDIPETSAGECPLLHIRSIFAAEKCEQAPKRYSAEGISASKFRVAQQHRHSRPSQRLLPLGKQTSADVAVSYNVCVRWQNSCLQSSRPYTGVDT